MQEQEKKLTVKSVALWVLGTYLITCMQAAARYSVVYGCTTRQSMTIRYIGGLVLAVALVVAIRRSLRPIKSANWRLQTRASFALAFVTFGVFTGAQLIGVGMTTAFGYSWPAFSLMIGWMRGWGFKEKPDFRSVTSVLITVMGVGMLASKVPQTHGNSTDMVFGICAVLWASFCNAYRVNVTPQIKKVDHDPFTGLIWMMFVGAIAMAVLDVGVWFMPGPAPAWPELTLTSVLVMSLIAIFGVSSLFATIVAQSMSSVKSLTPLTSLFQLPFALSVGHFAFGEPWPNVEQMVWMAVIVAGSLLNYLPMPDSHRSGKAS
jgi:drug/metabolite transporter (DMT)-like permease